MLPAHNITHIPFSYYFRLEQARKTSKSQGIHILPHTQPARHPRQRSIHTLALCFGKQWLLYDMAWLLDKTELFH